MSVNNDHKIHSKNLSAYARGKMTACVSAVPVEGEFYWNRLRLLQTTAVLFRYRVNHALYCQYFAIGLL